MTYQITNQKQTILIVDDDASIRMTAAYLLEERGYSILEADSAETCLDICQIQRPDIILLDAIMTGMNGFTCASKIKAIFALECPPIFMMTALDDCDSIYRSFDVGITDYFVKPLDWQSLPDKIARVFLIRNYSKSIKKQFQELNSLKKQMNHNLRTMQKDIDARSIRLNYI